MENFQSRHKKENEYKDKKGYLSDFYALEHDKLVLIAYRRNKDKKKPEHRRRYFKRLNQFDKEMLLEEIGFKKSKIQEYLESLKNVEL